MRILVVDDSRSVSTALQMTLENRGYEVLVAKNGREALEMVQSFKPDLITMDVQMPEMDGFEASRQIRAIEAGKAIPIIFVTSNDTLEDREKGFMLGATEFISKKGVSPWNEVAQAVDRILKTDQRLEGFTILVVEDDEIARMLVANCLRTQGGRVLEATSGSQAIEIVSRQMDKLDLVISDFIMPEMDGEELCRALRQRLGLLNIPIIILSEVDQRDTMMNLYHAGATDYITKPFIKEEFIARVSSHLEVRELIKELSTNLKELERLNKLRDEFVAVSSHDLKTPLNGIIGFSKLLLEEEDISEKQREWLEAINNSAEFMLQIVNDIVELNRNEAKSNEIVKTPLAVLSVIKVALNSVQQAAITKGISLQIENNLLEEPVVEGDRNQFIRILNNLLSNAVKFTPSGGFVKIKLDAENGDFLIISVMDNGVGISQDMLSSLFDKFTKASKPGTAGEPGTGLGMSITKQLVDSHGGTIEVQSEEGKGTCFTLTFPTVAHAKQ